MKQYLVYLLICSDNSIYCGITNDLDKRLKAHQAGTASKYTRARLPVAVYKTFPVASKSEALKLEYKIKSLSRAEKLKL